MDLILEEDSNKWLKSKSQSYNDSCNFAIKLICTNDKAERNSKFLEDNLEEGQFERVFFNIIYWLFQSIVNWRKVIVQNQMGRIIQFNLNTLSSVNTRSLGRPFKIKVKFLSLQNYIKLKYKFELIGLRSLLALQ